MAHNIKFSVLLSLYKGEKAQFFDEAMQSIYEQTLSPTEIVLVQDGPLNKDLYDVIESWKGRLNIVDVVIANNVGLGEALNQGLQHCSYELVARMDTDDIALPTRFEKQIAAFDLQNIDVCGSWISEFDHDPSTILSIRQVPEYHADITKFAKSKNPMNHPSVMFKKTTVVKCGGYQNVLYFEDYFLWLSLIKSGAILYNIPSPLVHMRAGLNQLSRRSGYLYFKREFNFFKKSYKSKLLPLGDVLKNMALRMPLRLLPKAIIAKIYSLLRN
ncbi:glycosyltransferase [Pseudoalteromonas sp. SCSIO_11900]|uniref:glycosyltransferase n=1 Tax=Pseudoalteromonas sp. SCSIO_11900 TaxID=1461766 RepID=UPI0004B9462A|nr:glycosyltransferase [Pseudoalteromonas sp. SCSIO_11900]